VSLTSDTAGNYAEGWLYITPSLAQLGYSNFPTSGGWVTVDADSVSLDSNQGGDKAGVLIKENQLTIKDDVSLVVNSVVRIQNITTTPASNTNPENTAVLIGTGAGLSSVINAGLDNVVVVSGNGITANTDNTAYANQVSLQQAGNALNTFIVPSAVTVSDKTATIQDKSGTIAYLSDIPGGSANMYNVDGTLTANRTLDGNLKVNSLFFIQLGSFQVALTDNILLSSDGAAELTGTTLALGGSTQVGISTPNIVATLGKIGQVLTLSNTAGICDWEDKYFAIDLHSVNHPTIVSVVNVGSNWTYTVIHNLDSLDVKPEIFRLSDGKSVGAAIKRINVNEVTVRVKSTLIPNGVYRIII